MTDMPSNTRKHYAEDLRMCRECTHESCETKWCFRVTSLVRVEKLGESKKVVEQPTTIESASQ